MTHVGLCVRRPWWGPAWRRRTRSTSAGVPPTPPVQGIVPHIENIVPPLPPSRVSSHPLKSPSPGGSARPCQSSSSVRRQWGRRRPAVCVAAPHSRSVDAAGPWRGRRRGCQRRSPCSAPPGSSSAGVGGTGPLVATPRPWQRERAARRPSRPAPTDSSLDGERGSPGVAHTELRSRSGQEAEAHTRRHFWAVLHSNVVIPCCRAWPSVATDERGWSSASRGNRELRATMVTLPSA